MGQKIFFFVFVAKIATDTRIQKKQKLSHVVAVQKNGFMVHADGKYG